MSDSSADRSPQRRLRPAPLLFEPGLAEPEKEHFFDLESIEDPQELLARAIEDPQELLARATELTLAFRAAAERASEFQALAAAQLADPRRFDSLSLEEIAATAEWTPDYAAKMVEYGRGLQQRQPLD